MKQLKDFIGTAIIVAILTVALGLWLQNGVLANMPVSDGASQQSFVIVELLNAHFWAIAFLFALIGGIMLYSIIFFRQKKGEDEYGEYMEGNTTLEIIWTIVPLGFVLWFAYLGGGALQKMEVIRPDAVRINVIGQQWSWSFEYPEAGVTSDVLYLPVDDQAWLRLRSRDVIHSFWVPELGPKQDLLPGDEIRDLRITPTEAGEYQLVCAELCGKQHSTMRADVVVVSRAEFDAWLDAEIAKDPCLDGDEVGCGQKLATENACLGCHSIDGTALAGPTWLGVYGSEETLTDGTTVTVDDAYLIDSIKNPNANVVEGFVENVMPQTFGETLTDEQIDSIVAFIASLAE
jgi:cytochrome c oxidase subunit 2